MTNTLRVSTRGLEGGPSLSALPALVVRMGLRCRLLLPSGDAEGEAEGEPEGEAEGEWRDIVR